MEKSSAIKCPDIYTQITNCKYFQYLINKKETWDHFGFSDEEFMTNRDTFCDILTTGDFNEDKEKMKNYILENGGFDLFVLKPQKEGGANNYFGSDIQAKIDSSDVNELRSYILMKRIFPT